MILRSGLRRAVLEPQEMPVARSFLELDLVLQIDDISRKL